MGGEHCRLCIYFYIEQCWSLGKGLIPGDSWSGQGLLKRKLALKILSAAKGAMTQSTWPPPSSLQQVSGALSLSLSFPSLPESWPIGTNCGSQARTFQCKCLLTQLDKGS